MVWNAMAWIGFCLQTGCQYAHPQRLAIVRKHMPLTSMTSRRPVNKKERFVEGVQAADVFPMPKGLIDYFVVVAGVQNWSWANSSY